MIVQVGVPDKHVKEAAQLYWDAFGAKLKIPLGPKEKALAFTQRVLGKDHGIVALSEEGELLGVAGFKTAKGALVGGEFGDLRAIFGWFGASWRAALLSLLERDTENERFLMDGIFVAENARGQGVGTDLLRAICDEARNRKFDQVRLDVIDTNPRAKALYARLGFQVVKTENIGFLHHLFGFNSADTMVLDLNNDRNDLRELN